MISPTILDYLHQKLFVVDLFTNLGIGIGEEKPKESKTHLKASIPKVGHARHLDNVKNDLYFFTWSITLLEINLNLMPGTGATLWKMMPCRTRMLLR